MEERKFIRLKKEEFGIKEYIKRDLGKGKISKLDIEYTPVGEKIIISTNKPGLVIGKRGEKIHELTEVLKKRFKLENPHIEIQEIENPLFDAQSVADEMAMALERMGNLKFKVIAYRKLREIMDAGALGCEMRFTGKLPSERAKSWRFVEGYLKKAGEPKKEVDRAQATALTKTGIIGIKVAIMDPHARIYDRIDIDSEMKARIKGSPDVEEESGRVSSTPTTPKSHPEQNELLSPIKSNKPLQPQSPSTQQGLYGDKKNIDNLKQDKGSEGVDGKSGETKKKVKKEKIKSEEDIEKEIVKEELKKVKGHKETKGEAEKEIAEKIAEEVDEEKKVEKAVEKFEEEHEIPAEEDGTAIAIEQEIEEGVPEGLDKELKELEEKHEENVEGKVDKGEEIKEEGKDD